MPQTTPKVSPQQAKNWLDSGEAVIFDVREKAEFNEEHIPGAVCHPVSSLNVEQIRSLAAGKKIVFQCASGKRAGMACEKFADSAQNDNIFLMEGSLPGWKQAGLATEKGGGVISLERQVMIVAGFLVLSGFLLSIAVAPGFIWLCGFVGAGLFFAGVSGTCMMKKLLMQLPFNKS